VNEENLTLAHLLAVAPGFGVTVRAQSASDANVGVEVVSPSGAATVFELTVRCDTERPLVFEREPRQLPTMCIERHINDNGSFCLEWPAIAVTDTTSAVHFWSQVARFLEHQRTATALRRWPGAQNDRAHGEAAQPQSEAEMLARALGPGVEAGLRRGEYRVRRVAKRGNTRLELYRGNSRLVQVRLPGLTLIGNFPRCICDVAMQARGASPTCAEHAHEVASFVEALERWHRLHARHIDLMVARGYQCCGTLNECEIARRQHQPRRNVA
jgi:hypothetical protein